MSGLDRPAVPPRQTFVQTNRRTHVEWGKLAVAKPVAAAVMHHLVALMDKQNAVVIDQQTLADIVGVHRTTIKQAIRYLRDHRWLDIVRIGKRGTVNAYVINTEVGWADLRDNLRLAIFTARIVADASDQEEDAPPGPLRRVPVIYPPEEALPTGPLQPGDQEALPGLEPVIVGPRRDDPVPARPVSRMIRVTDTEDVVDAYGEDADAP